MNLYTLPFLCNVVILLPIALPTLFGIFSTDQKSFCESEGWRMLVGSIWTSILVLSIAGLIFPEKMSCLLVMQVIYKLIWLLTYVAPKIWLKRYKEIPIGISLSFFIIVFLYPFMIPWKALFIE